LRPGRRPEWTSPRCPARQPPDACIAPGIAVVHAGPASALGGRPSRQSSALEPRRPLPWDPDPSRASSYGRRRRGRAGAPWRCSGGAAPQCRRRECEPESGESDADGQVGGAVGAEGAVVSERVEGIVLRAAVSTHPEVALLGGHRPDQCGGQDRSVEVVHLLCRRARAGHEEVESYEAEGAEQPPSRASSSCRGLATAQRGWLRGH
jgi:hypothetical protein